MEMMLVYLCIAVSIAWTASWIRLTLLEARRHVFASRIPNYPYIAQLERWHERWESGNNPDQRPAVREMHAPCTCGADTDEWCRSGCTALDLADYR